MSRSYLIVIVEVLILQRFPYGQDSTFFYYCYAADKNLSNLSVGDVVAVPWRKGLKNGVVVKTKKAYVATSPPSGSWQINLRQLIKDDDFFYSSTPNRLIQLKPIKNLVEKQFLSPGLLDKLNSAARQHGVSWNHFANYAVNLPPVRRKSNFAFLPSLSQWFEQLKKNNVPPLELTSFRLKKNDCSFIFVSNEQSWQLRSLLKKNLQHKKQILVIVPEKSHVVPIAAKYAFLSDDSSISTPIMLGKFLLPGIFRAAWQLAKSGNPHIFVGTRSAIFAPYSKLGLIILEEGHDASHKQWDLVPLYDTRNILKTLYPKVLKLYISGTPRLQDFFSSPCYLKDGNKGLATASIDWEKILAKQYPPALTENEEPPFLLKSSVIYENDKKNVSLVNTEKEKKFSQDPTALSSYLIKKLQSAVKRGRWAIILAGHGGFANIILCKDCGFIPRCPHCGKYLKIQIKKLFYCSFCGRDFPAYNRCPQCAGHSFSLLNFGLEALREKMIELQKKIKFKLIILPDLKSSSRSLTAYWQELVAYCEKPAVLIGYSGVIAPARLLKRNVALAASVSFDNLLYHPDYRSEEKAAALFYNLLTLAPNIIVQTRDPLQPIWRKLLKLPYSALFPNWIRERQKFLYPPISRLVRIGVEGYQQSSYRARLRQLLLKEKGVYDVLEIPINPLSKTKYKTNFLVKLHPDTDWGSLLLKISPGLPKLKIDPDPEILI